MAHTFRQFSWKVFIVLHLIVHLKGATNSCVTNDKSLEEKFKYNILAPNVDFICAYCWPGSMRCHHNTSASFQLQVRSPDLTSSCEGMGCGRDAEFFFLFSTLPFFSIFSLVSFLYISFCYFLFLFWKRLLPSPHCFLSFLFFPLLSHIFPPLARNKSYRPCWMCKSCQLYYSPKHDLVWLSLGSWVCVCVCAESCAIYYLC